MSKFDLKNSGRLLPGEPLWSRAPTRDSNGELLNDFMMLIPRFSKWSEPRRQNALQELERVFNDYADVVVFADLNMKLNLLWVSLKAGSTGCLELSAAVREQIPEAVLVASHAEVLVGESRRTWRQFSLKRLGFS